MSYIQGIDFRATSGYVSDPTNCNCEPGGAGGALNYPRTTPQGNNVGWESMGSGSAIGSRDRSTTNDHRLAGNNSNPSTFVSTYRMDLPSAGSYSINLAAGDANYVQHVKVEWFDTTTSLGVLSHTDTTAANSFRDATDTQYTAANWPANNTSVTGSFATTILRLKVGTGATSDVIAHVFVTAVVPPTTAGGNATEGDDTASGGDTPGLPSTAGGNATEDTDTASGGNTIFNTATVGGNATEADDTAAGGDTIYVGTIQTDPVGNWTLSDQSAYANLTIPNVHVVRVATAQPWLQLTNQVTDSNRRLNLSDTKLLKNEWFVIVLFNADGSACGAKAFQAS